MPNCFVPAKILLPDANIPLSQWACLACDQFTSQPEYWQKAEALVEGKPSALHLVLPEVYLGKPGEAERIAAIQANMKEYRGTVLNRAVKGFVYVERDTGCGPVRPGLLGAVDLEQYSYTPGSSPAVRPTENTVVERIPPRLAVRRGASLELPHVMMLINDRDDHILGGLAAKKDQLRPLYNGELMLGGGSIRGWAVEDETLCSALSDAIEALGSQAAFDQEFPAAAGQPPITLAVGDGNHSLATAKAYWEELKPTLPPEQRENHPARWCLAEVCNLYSDSIQIESIPRVLFDVSADEVLRQLHAYAEERHLGLHLGEEPKGRQSFTLAAPDGRETAVCFDTPAEPLAVGTAEAFVQQVLANCPGSRVDYIHGDDTARRMAAEGAVGLILPPFDKADILKGVVLGGVLPRKTFSMGHAEEKRYYLEAREIQA